MSDPKPVVYSYKDYEEWLEQCEIRRKNLKTFIEFRDFFLASKLYTYIWTHGYQIIDQKIIHELLGLIRRYEKGKSYVTKKIDSFLKQNYPEDIENNSSIAQKTINTFMKSYEKNKPKGE